MNPFSNWLRATSPLSAAGRAVSVLFGHTRSHAVVARAMAVFLLMVTPPVSGAGEPLVLGVFPNMTARQIVEIYRPLADALEKDMQRPVVVYSARDFETFIERTRQGGYDIVLTAPHLAWLARQEVGYRPLLKYAQPVRGLLVVRADSAFTTPEALRGRTIAAADSIAVIVLALHAQLAAHGLRQGIDYQTASSGTHTNALLRLVNGGADAAMLGLHPYNLLPAESRKQLRVLAETPPLSSLMYLSHPRLDDRDAQMLRKSLLNFAATPEGKSFMKRGGYGGFKPVDGQELRAFRPYALQVQTLLGNPPK